MTEPLKSVDPAQTSHFASPWPASERLRRVLWEFCWFVFCAWTPKAPNPWRLFWLGVFDARIHGTPLVHQRARIAVPLESDLARSRLSRRPRECYSLGEIEIGARAVVAQEAYLNTGSHDFSPSSMPLVVAKITIGEDAFVGARAFVIRDQNRGARDRRGVFGRDQRCAGERGCGGKSVPGSAPARRQRAASLTTNIYITVEVSPNFFARSSRCSSMYFVWPKIRVITRKSGFLNSATSVSTTFEPASTGEIS